MRHETAQQAFIFRDYLGGMGLNDPIRKSKLHMANQAITTFDEQLNPQSVKDVLVETRPSLNKEHLNPRTLATAYVFNAVVNPMEDLAFSFKASNNLEHFIVWFDLSYGAGMVTGTLIMAEFESKGLAGEVQTQAVKSSQEMMPFEVDTKDVEDEVSARIKRAAELLNEDETGFTLIKEVVKSIKGEPNRFSQGTVLTQQIPDFVIRGAEFAGAVYKLAYPIAEEVLRT